jgi:hypothetical protein
MLAILGDFLVVYAAILLAELTMALCARFWNSCRGWSR